VLQPSSLVEVKLVGDLDGENETVGTPEDMFDSDGQIETVGIPVGYEVGERVLCRSHSSWFIDLNLVQLMEPLSS